MNEKPTTGGWEALKQKTAATTEKTTYYEDQLRAIKLHPEYIPTIKITGHGNSETKHLSLNKECAEMLVEWLQEVILNNGEIDNRFNKYNSK